MAVTTSMGLSSTMGNVTVTGAYQLVKMKISNLSGESLLRAYGEQKLSETGKPDQLNLIINVAFFRNKQTGSASCKDNICPPGELDFVICLSVYYHYLGHLSISPPAMTMRGMG